ncbi:HPr family phosphocarrier protein [Thiorhodospira sibirica]|uniref:HPr family phosphocarrier protein n=1 Tax=Thiorhodospira sibirica TaxID=154347 RepID=UPI00022C5857|nr:HPr family phosphocarrier protein [Thiorhodospira sibirica]
MSKRSVDIVNKLGMHARAAAKFVNLASGFRCQIELEKGSRRVNGKSIMGVMMLAASKGSKIQIIAQGEDAEAALDALESLIQNRFGEPE